MVWAPIGSEETFTWFNIVILPALKWITPGILRGHTEEQLHGNSDQFKLSELHYPSAAVPVTYSVASMFSLLLLFCKNKRGLMSSPCCLHVRASVYPL
jgi:hypothetical protein